MCNFRSPQRAVTSYEFSETTDLSPRWRVGLAVAVVCALAVFVPAQIVTAQPPPEQDAVAIKSGLAELQAAVAYEQLKKLD